MSNHEQASIDFVDFVQKYAKFENVVEKDVRENQAVEYYYE